MSDKRVTRRRFLEAAALAIGALASAGSLQGCASSTPPPATQAPAPKAAATTAPAPAATAAPAKGTAKGKISFWTDKEFTDAYNNYLVDQIKEGAAAIGYDVDILLITMGEGPIKWKAAVETNTMPDLAIQIGEFPEYYAMGKLTDISDVVAEAGKAGGGFYEWALNMVSFEGKQFGMPFGGIPWIMYHWTPLFKEAGYQLPLKSFDELVEAAKKITKPEKDIYGCGFPLGKMDTDGHIYPIIWAFGGAFQDKDENLTINKQEVVDAVTWYTDLFTKHKVIPPGATSWAAVGNNEFYLGRKGALVFNPGSLTYAMRQNAKDLLQESYLDNWPKGPVSNTQATTMELRRLVVTTSSKQADAAKAVAKHLLSPKVYSKLVELAGGNWQPTLKDVSKIPFLTDDPYNKAVVDKVLPLARNTGYPGNDNPWLGESFSQRWWGDAITDVCLKNVKPKDAVASFAEKVQGSREKYLRAIKQWKK